MEAEAGGGGGGGGLQHTGGTASNGGSGGGGGGEQVLLSIDSPAPAQVVSNPSSRHASNESISSRSGGRSPLGEGAKARSNGVGGQGSVSPLALAHTKDRRGERLALLGLALTVAAFLVSLTSVSTSQWARLAGLAGGFMGPFLTCQDSYRGYSECSAHSRPPANAAIFAGVCASAACLLALAGAVLAVAVLAMHRSEQRVLLKFRHATLVRMIALAAAGCLSFLSVLAFVVEVYLLRSSSPLALTWGFYLQVLAMLLLWGAGAGSSAEWHKSRKLGGDPTLTNRDPQGLHAHTISNPHFQEDGPPATRQTPAARSTSPPARSMSPSGKVRSAPAREKPLPTPSEVHRNTNGVAMTAVSGQPYVMAAQNGSNGHVANGRSSLRRPSSKAASNNSKGSKGSGVGVKASRFSRKGGSSSNGNSNPVAFVAFDPNRAPGRSSLRKPKKQQLQQSAPPTEGADAADGATPDGGIPNLAFAQSSPLPKKKVRIHTQSTAV